MSVIKQCRTCGKDYKYCGSFRGSTLFRWQDVACSPECGNIYFRKILESRGQDPSIIDQANNQGTKTEPSDTFPNTEAETDDDELSEFELDYDYDDEDEEDF